MQNNIVGEISRTLHNRTLVQQSKQIGMGAGVGILLAGGGLVPVLTGVALTMAASGAVQAMWRSYKRGTESVSLRQLHEAHLNSLSIPSEGTPRTRASEYNDFYDMLAKFATTNTVEGQHLVMLAQLKNNIKEDIERTEQLHQSTATLPQLHGKAKELLAAWAEPVAQRAWAQAVDRPNSLRLNECTEHVRAIDSARQVLDILDKEGLGGIKGGRHTYILREKLQAIQAHVDARGINAMDYVPERRVEQTAYLHGEIARVGSILSHAVNPNKPTGEATLKAEREALIDRAEHLGTLTWRSEGKKPHTILWEHQQAMQAFTGLAKEHPEAITITSLRSVMVMQENIDHHGQSDEFNETQKYMFQLARRASEKFLVDQTPQVLQRTNDQFAMNAFETGGEQSTSDGYTAQGAKHILESIANHIASGQPVSMPDPSHKKELQLVPIEPGAAP